MKKADILRENKRRIAALVSTYNPVTGEGCRGKRFLLEIPDAPYPKIWLPESMKKLNVVRSLLKEGSIKAAIEKEGVEFSRESKKIFWELFCEERAKRDFEFFAALWVTIEDGLSGEIIPLVLNRGQRRLLESLESQRESKRPIRTILLKARQWGGSTLVEMYMLWIQLMIKKNWNSCVCAHIEQASIVIRAMLTNAVKRMPNFDGQRFVEKGFEGTRNIRTIKGRGCTITVGSAESPESIRSQNIKMAHFSEVALYPDTDKKTTTSLIGSVIGTLKMVDNSLVVYESTAKGIGDFFHEEWVKATNGKSAFDPVFVEWFMIDAYKESIEGTFHNPDGKLVNGSMVDFVNTLDEREIAMFYRYPGMTLENLNWYRAKRSEFSHVSIMQNEYPGNPEEAFQGSGTPVFRFEDVEKMRPYCRPPVAIGTIASTCPPELARAEPWRNKAILDGLQFVPDEPALEKFQNGNSREKELAERDKLKIWAYPDHSVKMKDRYVVVFDPQKGLSEQADWGVITVFDRYWMSEGGVPEVVAEWKGRLDKDVTIWIAAQVASLYANAHLVVECNTYDSGATDDYSEFIFDTIAKHYRNLYAHDDADKLKENIPVKYGFHMNRSTKPMIVFDYIAILREGGYRERNVETLEQAHVYEKTKTGKYEAKHGHHDDNLVTRMIGCWICYRLPLPRLVLPESSPSPSRITGMSSM